MSDQQHNQTETMFEFEYDGRKLFEQDEMIYGDQGELIGYITQRGAQYGWGLIVEGEVVMSGSALWDPSSTERDPSVAALLKAQERWIGATR